MILLKTIVLWKMDGDNFSYLLMFYLLGAVFQTVPTQAEFTCLSLRDDHKCSKSITDNSDATDLFFSRIFSFGFVCACRALGSSRIYLSLRTSLAICNPAPYRRKYNPKEIQDQVNPKIKRNPWKDKIRRIRVIRELFWACAHWAEGEGAIY